MSSLILNQNLPQKSAKQFSLFKKFFNDLLVLWVKRKMFKLDQIMTLKLHVKQILMYSFVVLNLESLNKYICIQTN